MSAVVQLDRQTRHKAADALTPVLRAFLDQAIVPALVEAYLAELEAGDVPGAAVEPPPDSSSERLIRNEPSKDRPGSCSSS